MRGHWTFRYGVAVACPVLATGITLLLLDPLFVRNPFALFYASVMLSAWYGGLGPGMLATACSVWAIHTFFLPSFVSFAGPRDFVQVAIFGGVALLISSLNAMRKRAIAERDALLAREQSARAESELARRRSALLADASNLLGAAMQSPAAIDAVARRVVPEFADWCIVDVVDPDAAGTFHRVAIESIDDAEHRTLASRLLREHALPDNTGGVGRVIRTGEAELVARVSAESLADLAEREPSMAAFVAVGAASYVTVPLQARGRTLGALSFISSDAACRYGDADVRLAADLAHRLAVAIDNARLYRDAQDANRMKDEFLAVVSHELRTPLNAILGWAQLLHNGALDEPSVAQGMSAIERNARSQARIIDDVLDVSRIIQGKLRLEMKPTALQAVIGDALDAVRPAAEAKGIALAVHVDSEAGDEDCVRGDSERLRQVAWNLLSNAIKFTPEGGRVDVTLARPDDGHLELSVRDTGKGIEGRFLPLVFERFRQADSSTTRAHGGLGLGLAIVRHLVELHGGSVNAESDGVGRGATFVVRLPLAPIPPRLAAALPMLQSAADQSALPPARSHPELAGLRVLLVEDEPDARELFSSMLQMCGADVTAVASARDALAAYERDIPDVLLSDIGMPGEDGYDLIRQIRAIESANAVRRPIPALAITAFARSEDRRLALSAGFQVHVAKPVGAAQFAAAVAALVRTSPAPSSASAPPAPVASPRFAPSPP